MSLHQHDDSKDAETKPQEQGPIQASLVLDLPQLYSRPSAATLLAVLSRLKVQPSSWDHTSASNEPGVLIDEVGIPAYLTRIVSNPLAWIDSESERERIWEAASARLAERSGRTALPSVSRTFSIPALSPYSSAPSTISITLHEPSLTGDNLGHKTWVASYLLAKRLPSLFSTHCSLQSWAWASKDKGDPAPESTSSSRPRILELGAGTGLVGLTASAIRTADIHLTDLPAIVPNLRHNVESNSPLVEKSGSLVTASDLDWSETPPSSSNTIDNEERYHIILAADSLYAPPHAGWLANTMAAYLRKQSVARIFAELPVRETSAADHEDFRYQMGKRGFETVEEGEGAGFDDWESGGGGVSREWKRERVEVRCWWSVWRWKQKQNLLE